MERNGLICIIFPYLVGVRCTSGSMFTQTVAPPSRGASDTEGGLVIVGAESAAVEWEQEIDAAAVRSIRKEQTIIAMLAREPKQC